MLLKIITVSENAPGAHRDVPRFSKVPRCGNTSRADGGSTVHPPGTAPALFKVQTVPRIPAHT